MHVQHQNTMTSHNTAPTGQFNMSNHPSMACHQPAPIPNMEVQSAIPAKRGPEEDVQFVSVKPVKKARGSRESPPSQIQPTLQQQSTTHLQGPPHVKQANDAQSSDNGVANAPQTGISTQTRGVSFPGVENYVFPPPPNAMPSRTSRSSPVLSPRQLPQSMLPPPPQHNMQAPPAYPTPGSGYRGLVPPPQFQIPWGMSALYPQPGPMHPEAATNGTGHVPAAQPQHVEPARCIEPGPTMDIDDQPLSMTTTLRRPEPSRAPTPVSQVEHQGGPQSGQIASAHDGLPSRPEESSTMYQATSNQIKHGPTQSLSPSSPRQDAQLHIHHSSQAQIPSRVQTPSQAHIPSQTQTPPPTPDAGQSQAQFQTIANIHNIQHAMGAHQVPTGQQAAKGPCAVCEQVRQQVLFNQANGLPTGHLLQMQHGWHGQSQVPQMHMGHLPPPMAAGYGMMPNMHQGFQQRYQPLPLGSLGHLPLGYGMPSIPIQMQMQMQMQRQAAASNMPGAEASPNGLPQSPQGQQNQEQQTPQGQVLHYVPGSGQPQPPQYVQSQLQPSPQHGMLQRPMIMHPQALAPPGPHPTSSEQPPAPEITAQAAEATQQPSPISEPAKEHSPNLIVDIAETCEELFPWDEVAKRHGVTRVKVVETFGAVIQLPLLRSTGDKKKHGKLATSRLREYTKAKKDAEAQNAAEAANAAARAKKKTATKAAAKPAAPIQQAKSQVAQVQAVQPQENQPPTTQAQANQAQANQAQTQQGQAARTQSQALQAQAAQMHTAQNQAMQTQAAMYANQVQNQAMQAQASQMQATQSHLNQGYPPQLQQHQDNRPTLPGVFEMANNMSPLGLPSNHANGLPGPWQQQQQQ